MTVSTPYFFYIAAAYGLTFFALSLFFALTIYRWKKTVLVLKNVSRET